MGMSKDLKLIMVHLDDARSEIAVDDHVLDLASKEYELGRLTSENSRLVLSRTMRLPQVIPR
jgi:hypothetical protein